MFGLVKESKYNELKHSNELLRAAVTNLENALRNQKIKNNELKIENEIAEAEREAAVNDLFNYTGSLVQMYDENQNIQDEVDKYKEAAEKIADIVLSLPWNNMNSEEEIYETKSNYTCDKDDMINYDMM